MQSQLKLASNNKQLWVRLNKRLTQLMNNKHIIDPTILKCVILTFPIYLFTNKISKKKIKFFFRGYPPFSPLKSEASQKWSLNIFYSWTTSHTATEFYFTTLQLYYQGIERPYGKLCYGGGRTCRGIITDFKIIHTLEGLR